MNTEYKTTFVTACFNCNKNKFFVNKYLKKSLRTITIECPLIIYCEEEYSPIFTEIRRLFGLDHITQVITVKLEDLFFYKYKHHLLRGEELETNYNKNAHIVMMNKFKFLQDSIQENKFSTTHFAWIDVNLLEKTFNNSVNYLDINIYDKVAHICNNPRDKFTIEVINQWTPDMYADLGAFYSKYQWIVAGCFFTLEKEVGKIVLEKLINKAIEITMKGFGSGEESFFSFVIDECPDLFNLYVGDYQDTVHNYYRIETNKDYVKWIVEKWKNSGREVIYSNIMRTIGGSSGGGL
jgi:hypothetical protein